MHLVTRSSSIAVAACVALLCGACGGASPKSVTVASGSSVTFINNANQPHDMSSDPHPQHTDCAEMNGVGFVQPGQTKSTNAFRTVRT